MTSSKLKILTPYVFASAVAILPATLHAQDAESRFNFYGQINLGVLSVDDGVESDTIFTDNDNSNSRIGYTYDWVLNGGNKLRFHFESALGLSGSARASATNDNFDVDFRRTELRRFDFQYTTARYGKFYVGQGSTATDGIAEEDLSRTGVISYSSITDVGGGVTFRLADGSASTVRVGNTFSNFDGARRFRVRYDTPSFSGFTVSTSFGTEELARNDDREFTDIAVRYAGEFGDFKIAAGLGHISVSGGDDTTAGSFSMLHNPTGLNLTLAAGENHDSDASYTYVKGGIVRDWFPIGYTAISLDYTDGSDFVSRGSETESIGLAVVQKVDKWNTEIFALYRTYEFSDTSGASYQDVDAIFVGARFRF